jgi:hypothetical protein
LELEGMAGVGHITTKPQIIMVTITNITRMGGLTRIETMIRAGRMILIRASHMTGIDKASIDCIVHPGDLGRFSGAARSISKS